MATPLITQVSRVSLARTCIQWSQAPGDAGPFRIQASVTGVGDWFDVASGIEDPWYVHRTGSDDSTTDGSDTRHGTGMVYRVSSDDGLSWSAGMDTWGSVVLSASVNQAVGVTRNNDGLITEHSGQKLFYGPSDVVQNIANMRAARWETQTRAFFGVQVVILKRRRFGPRCPRCYQAGSNNASNGSCRTCYTTTYNGGFHTPILTMAKLNVDGPSEVRPTEAGRAKSSQSRGSFGPFPALEDGDVVVDLRRRRWFTVTGVDHKTLQGRRYGTKCTLSEMPLTHVITTFPLGEADRWVRLVEPE
jgi:hypothetical protein